ncbi:MAG: hypothetical protein GC171_09090 [Terrimonas sp.]|nr:hypothetical protein [Terrimonas sp.]
MFRIFVSITFFTGVFIAFPARALAQADPVLSKAEENIRQIYFSQRGNELPLYNGKQHFAYPSSIEGSPYFNSFDWMYGDIVYEHVGYKHILMRYDLVKDELIIVREGDDQVYIALNTDRVSSFLLAGIPFVQAADMPSAHLPEGFFQVLVRGNLTVLVKNKCDIEEHIDGSVLSRSFLTTRKFYGIKKGVAVPVKNKNDLLGLTDNHKKEIQRFIRDNQLNFRKDPERTIAAVVNFYNQSGF